jgi:hypothetical protein
MCMNSPQVGAHEVEGLPKRLVKAEHCFQSWSKFYLQLLDVSKYQTIIIVIEQN